MVIHKDLGLAPEAISGVVVATPHFVYSSRKLQGALVGLVHSLHRVLA